VPTGLGWELLYDAIAAGMRLYSRASFRVVTLGAERLRMEQGLLVVATHRSDADVPLICSELYFGPDRMYLRHRLRLEFAARDDLFEQGVLAGLAPSVYLPLRRLLFAVDPSRALRSMGVHPIRGATTMKAVQALRHDPATPIEQALPAALAERFLARAPASERALLGRDVDRAELADLLWSDVRADELPDAADLWRARAAASAGDLRRLIAVVRSGEPLLLFPEGPPSPDGRVGPLRRGVGLLVRRGAPRRLLPLALAYDDLTLGRPRVILSVGAPFPPPADDVEWAVLAALRSTMPLTCTQVVSSELVRAAEAGEEATTPSALERGLADAVASAVRERRPVDPGIAAAGLRRRRLTDCLASLVRMGALSRLDAGSLLLDRDRLLEEGRVRQASAEYESVGAPVAMGRR
jgi:1-acyl-sn-glycerol-3-phosphate acyltransferase